jgi:hypothetical protein
MTWSKASCTFLSNGMARECQLSHKGFRHLQERWQVRGERRIGVKKHFARVEQAGHQNRRPISGMGKNTGQVLRPFRIIYAHFPFGNKPALAGNRQHDQPATTAFHNKQYQRAKKNASFCV